MSPQRKNLSIYDLAKDGQFEDLKLQVAAGEEVNLATIFERAVTDFRTVPRTLGHQQILKWCVDRGLDLKSRAGWLNRSMVSLAAAAGNNEIVNYIVAKEPPKDPFVWASLGEIELLESYARNHAVAELKDKNGFNLLFNCAESGLGKRDPVVKQRLANVCRLLLNRGVDPLHEVKYALPISPVFLCAAYGGNREIMSLLLENSELIDERFALAMEHSLEPHQRSGEPFHDIADCLLQHGYNINGLRLDQGRTLLHGSANRGTINAVQWLLKNGADPNVLDVDGRTPLHACARRNTSTAVAKLLINAGCEPSKLDLSGKSAVDYARENGRSAIVKYLESIA